MCCNLFKPCSDVTNLSWSRYVVCSIIRPITSSYLLYGHFPCMGRVHQLLAEGCSPSATIPSILPSQALIPQILPYILHPCLSHFICSSPPSIHKLVNSSPYKLSCLFCIVYTISGDPCMELQQCFRYPVAFSTLL